MISYNFRTFCKKWCEEVRQEIMNYIAYEIGDVVREQYKFEDASYKLKYRGDYVNKDDQEFYKLNYGKNTAVDQFVFQIYYDEDTRTIFMMYELDNVIRNNLDPKDLTNKINNRLYNNFQRVTNYHLKIIDYYHYDRYQESRGRSRVIAVPVNIETFSYWKCYDGMYRFITGKNLIKTYIHYHKGEAIVRELRRINAEYNFSNINTNEHNVKEAFGILQASYKKHLGIELKPIPDEEVYIGWMDPYYPHLGK